MVTAERKVVRDGLLSKQQDDQNDDDNQGNRAAADQVNVTKNR